MKCIVPIDIVSLGDSHSYHLFVRGTINGKKYDILIDTGASQTVFDSALIPELNETESEKPNEVRSAGINAGELKSTVGKINRFKLGKIDSKNWRVVLIDLSHVNEMYKSFSTKRVAGLIGSDFLLEYKAIIDYKKRELTLRNIKQKH